MFQLSPMRKFLLLSFEVLFLFYLIGLFFNQHINYSVSQQLYTSLEKVPSREYALVLGCAKQGKNGINPFFRARLDATVELYEAGKIEQIIVSGDNHKIGYNEPADMTLYLQEKGIPSSKIIQDYAGFRTLDSVLRAKKIFNCKDLIIVSQKPHNQRAVYIANSIHINAVGYNATNPKEYATYSLVREYFAKILMISDIYLFKTNPKFY
jgi:SanA protein